jgi:hypothetical protein
MDWRWVLGISPDTAPQGRPPAAFYDGIRKKSEMTFDNVKGRRTSDKDPNFNRELLQPDPQLSLDRLSILHAPQLIGLHLSGARWFITEASVQFLRPLLLGLTADHALCSRSV